MNQNNPADPSPTVGDIRWLGAKSVMLICRACQYRQIANVELLPDDVTLALIASKFECPNGHQNGAHALPNWEAAPNQPSAVLILGRFTDERKAVLNALREELRKRDYLPILFDFELPERRNITETVTLLARMARFIIADLTDPSSIPQELQAIIPLVRVPVQPLLLEGSSLFSMFKDFDPQDFHWVLPVYRYKEPEQLLATRAENVIAPVGKKVKALEERRRLFEAQLRT